MPTRTETTNIHSKGTYTSLQAGFPQPLGNHPTDGTMILKTNATYMWTPVGGSAYYIVCVVADQQSLTANLKSVSFHCLCLCNLFLWKTSFLLWFLMKVLWSWVTLWVKLLCFLIKLESLSNGDGDGNKSIISKIMFLLNFVVIPICLTWKMILTYPGLNYNEGR